MRSPKMSEALHRAADHNMRNLQSEITWRLAQSLEDHPVEEGQDEQPTV